MAISEKNVDSPPEQYYTDAPVDYDWSWTRTLVENVATTKRGRPVRLVSISDAYHADYQVGRYQSGMHLTINESEYRKQVDCKLLTPTPEAEVHYFRKVIDLTAGIEDAAKNKALRPYVIDYRKDRDASISFESCGDYNYRLTVKGKKPEAEAIFDRLVSEIEAILKA